MFLDIKIRKNYKKSIRTFACIFLLWSIFLDVLFLYLKKETKVNKEPVKSTSALQTQNELAPNDQSVKPTNVLLIPMDNQPAPCQEAFTKASKPKDSYHVYRSIEKICATAGGQIQFRIINSEKTGEPIGVLFTCPANNTQSPIFSCIVRRSGS
jgi:hypothetical protein